MDVTRMNTWRKKAGWRQAKATCWGVAIGWATVGALMAQSTASIVIGGKVSSIQQVTVSPQTGYDSLDLVKGANGQVVALVNERSNSGSGFKVYLRSANAQTTGASQAFLKGITADKGEVIGYTVKYGGQAVQFATGGEALITNVAGRTGQSGQTKELAVTINGGTRSFDTYTDTLTLVLANN
jgi:hypothetical protein